MEILDQYVDEMKEALACAKDILDYASGDAWERECTQKSRDRFYELYNKLFAEENKEPIPDPLYYCIKCSRPFPHAAALKSHLDTSKKHKEGRKVLPVVVEKESEDSEGEQMIQREIDNY
jgi:hypothetical protein